MKLLFVSLLSLCTLSFASCSLSNPPTRQIYRSATESPAQLRALGNATDLRADRQYISCSASDVLFVIESSAKQLMTKFDGAMKDVKLIAKLLVDANEKGGEADPVLQEDMCCCNTPDWEELRSAPWAGFHDCNDDRRNELFYGNNSMDGGYGVFTGTRSINTDLAWLSPASTLFPWIIDRQKVSFDRDSFYAAAWIGTNGEVWSYYPGFNQIWPDHYFGDFIGGDYNGREDIFVKPTLPTQNPLRKPLWTQPYYDPAGAGNLISAITPVYFDGPFRGHTFRDEYVASTGIDVLLVYMEDLVAAVKPTASSLPLVVDDEGHLVSAPQEVVETIFGEGVTLSTTIQCAGEGSAISQESISCKIMSSHTADWAFLMDQILAQPRGQRQLLNDPLKVSRGGVMVPHTVAMYRWEGEDTPNWNSLVLVPVEELENAFRWEVPQEVSAQTDRADGQVEVELTLRNAGNVDLQFRLKWLPEFAAVKMTTPAGQHEEGALFLLSARSAVTYTLLLEAQRTSGRGTHSQTLAWELQDDDYPDCLVQNEVSVVINLEVNTPNSDWVALVAAIISSLLALVVAAWLYINWKRRQADAIWNIKLRDLHFKTDPPEVLGRGTYGLVVAAEYRKTQVAVKRVIPPAAGARGDEGVKSMASLFGNGVAQPKQADLLNALFAHRTSPADAGPAPAHANTAHGARPEGVAGGGSLQAWKPQSQASFGMHSGIRSGTSSRQGLLAQLLQCLASEHRRLRQDFIEEMRHVSNMRHPCITTMMGAVISNKCEPMLVMELMEHGSLYDLTHNRTVEFSGELVIPILRHVAQGLTFLHHHPLIHGDIKAANVLVDAQFRGKVTDFGLTAKRYTSTGPCGTPFWMAPELLRGEGNSPQADIYALGVTIFEVYARAEPYADEDPREVLDEVADATVAVSTTGRTARRPRIPDDCPAEVSRIIRECWHSDPSCRPAAEEIDRMLKTLDPGTMGPSRARPFGRLTSSMNTAAVIKRAPSDAGVRSLLHEVFPKRIAEKLLSGQKVQPEHKEEVTIFFSDIVGFTDIAGALSGEEISDMLDRLYTQFDDLSRRHGVFKVETIGDAYMAVTNLEEDQGRDHAMRIAKFAIDAIEAAAGTWIHPARREFGRINIRVGFHTGPVVANVVGTRNPRFCLFGDTVNTASRMESNSIAGRIHCSERAANVFKKQLFEAGNSLPAAFNIESRGEIQVKGKGRMNTFWVSRASNDPKGPVPEDAALRSIATLTPDAGNDSPSSPKPEAITVSVEVGTHLDGVPI